MEDPEKLERIVEARMKLKARFEQQMQATPSMADDLPKGSGKPNRHGMQRIAKIYQVKAGEPAATVRLKINKGPV